MGSLIRYAAGLLVLAGSAIAGPVLADDCSLFTSYAEGANQRQQINDFTVREAATSDCRFKLTTVTFAMSVAPEQLQSDWLASATSQLGTQICSLGEAADAIRAGRWIVQIHFKFPDGRHEASPLHC